MKESGFFRDSDESATAASQIPDVVLIVFVFDLGMKSWDAFIDNMYLIFGMPSDGSAVLFEGEARGQWGLALFDDKLIKLFFVFGLCLSAFPLPGLDLLDLINNGSILMFLLLQQLTFLLRHFPVPLEASFVDGLFNAFVEPASKCFAGIEWLPLSQINIVVFDALRNPYDE